MQKKIQAISLLLIFVLAFSGCTANVQNANNVVPQEESVVEATEVVEEPAEETVEEAAEEVEAEPVEEVAEEGEESVGEAIEVATLAGPTGMGMIQLIDDESGIYHVSVYSAPDQITPKIINKEVMFATIPSNLAAVLYNKTGGNISIIATNVTGVLYVLENGDTVNTIEDLNGKTIYATGQGASPEYALNEILTANGMEPGTDVTIEFMAEHADLANMMAAGEVNLALVPEPFVSTVLAKNPDVKVKLSVNEEWQKIFGDEIGTPMGVTIVQNDFAAENPQAVADFMEAYASSVEFVTADPHAASLLIEEHGILAKAKLAENAIPRCMISFISGEENQQLLQPYFNVLFESNPASVGGTLPDEAIYYIP
jgi:NitT/TauT family transport system substrate-binding protein